VTGWARRHVRALVAFAVCAPLLTATAVAATAPPAPTGLTAVSPTRLAPALSWNAVAAASGGYRVYRGNTQVGSTSSTSYKDTSLKTSGTYSYTVKAVGVGNKVSAASAPATVIYDILAPTAVGAITAATPTAAAPSLTWAAVTDSGGSGLRRYEVFRDGQSRGFTTSASFVDTGAPDGSHSYTVVAEDGAGNRSPASAAKVVVVDSVPPTTPDAPQAASADTTAAPALSWSPSTDAGTGVAGYRVLRDGAVVATTTATSFTDSAATLGSHGYAIVAFDRAGNAATSASTVVVYDPTPPATPGGLAITGTPAGPRLSWNAVSDDTPGSISYRVSRDGQALATTPDTSYTDATAGDGSHSYTVSAVDRFGRRSAESSAVTLIVDSTAPATPLAVFAFAASGTNTVSWAASSDVGSGVSGYQVLRDGNPVATVTGTTYSEQADRGSVYRVVAVDAAGNTSGASLPATAGAPFPTGVSSRQVVDQSAPEKTAHPELAMVSVMLRWQKIQPDATTFDWSGLDASLADARDRHYRLIVRIMCGADAPAWLATDPDHPVQTLDLLSNDSSNSRWPGEMLVPVPWDPDLAWHYANLMRALNDHLQQPDGAGGTWADHVEFVPVAMPSVLSSEMSTGYGSGTYTGVYKGVSGTYDRATVNRAEWDAHATSGTTSADKQLSNRNDLEAAWHTAIDVQEANLTVVPSAIAYGALLGDGYAAAQRIAASEVPQWGDRLWSMMTNLQPKVRADGTLGPYSEWSAPAAQTITVALQHGGVVGFQTAGNGIIGTAAEMRELIADGITNYNMRFLETTPEATDAFPDLLLNGPNNAQQQLQARFGG
jgi:fibronectin type 3 domain-containing protein